MFHLLTRSTRRASPEQARETQYSQVPFIGRIYKKVGGGPTSQRSAESTLPEPASRHSGLTVRSAPPAACLRQRSAYLTPPVDRPAAPDCPVDQLCPCQSGGRAPRCR